jgi:hypothetical protein
MNQVQASILSEADTSMCDRNPSKSAIAHNPQLGPFLGEMIALSLI